MLLYNIFYIIFCSSNFVELIVYLEEMLDNLKKNLQ